MMHGGGLKKEKRRTGRFFLQLNAKINQISYAAVDALFRRSTTVITS